MKKSYNECQNKIKILENKKDFSFYIYCGNDSKSTKSEIVFDFLNEPFRFVDSIIQATSSCYLKKEEIEIYFDIKMNYQSYVKMKIDYFMNYKNADYDKFYMKESIEKSKEKVQKYINQQIRKWYAEDEQCN